MFTGDTWHCVLGKLEFGLTCKPQWVLYWRGAIEKNLGRFQSARRHSVFCHKYGPSWSDLTFAPGWVCFTVSHWLSFLWSQLLSFHVSSINVMVLNLALSESLWHMTITGLTLLLDHQSKRCIRLSVNPCCQRWLWWNFSFYSVKKNCQIIKLVKPSFVGWRGTSPSGSSAVKCSKAASWWVCPFSHKPFNGIC